MSHRELAFSLALGLILALLPACLTGSDQPEEVETVYDKTEFEAAFSDHIENAQQYYNRGDWMRALNQFIRARKQQPLSPAANMGEAMSRYQIGVEKAKDGNVAESRKQLVKAEEVLRPIWSGTIEPATGDGDQWRNALSLAMIERAIGNVDKVEADQLDASTRQPDAAKRREAFARQQELRLHRNDYYDRALDKFERLASMKNAAPDAILNTADLRYVRGNVRGAETAYLEYIDIARLSVKAWETRREQVPETYKLPSDQKIAIETIELKLIGAKRKTVNTLTQLARIKFAKGRSTEFTASLLYLLEAQKLAPGRYQLNIPIAECHAGLGDYRKAVDAIDRYIDQTDGFGASTHRAFRLRSEWVKHLESGKK